MSEDAHKLSHAPIETEEEFIRALSEFADIWCVQKACKEVGLVLDEDPALVEGRRILIEGMEGDDPAEKNAKLDEFLSEMWREFKDGQRRATP